MWARYFRFSTPRSWDSTRQTWRLVQGFRGVYGDWDWDAALVASKATSKMNNHGRANLTLLDEALAKSTSDAYNPFCAGLNCGEEAFMTTIFRNNTTELYMVDFKMSNPSVYTLPAGDVGMLVGAEIRTETMDDSRDRRRRISARCGEALSIHYARSARSGRVCGQQSKEPGRLG